MQRACAKTGVSFEVSEADLAFYAKVSPVFGGSRFLFPPPTLCPLARFQRRAAFTNQMYVYSRACSATGKRIVAMYPTEVPFPVFSNDYWWSDAWDARGFGLDYNFGKSFFSQFKALKSTVPRMALFASSNENCDYVNNASNNKSCYIVFNTSYAEDCLYGENVWSSRDCIDCTHTKQSELCYDCVMCSRCYNIQSSEFCDDCIDSYALLNCRSCKHCFGCVNLSRKEYCVFNEQYSKEKYEGFINGLDLSSYAVRSKFLQDVQEFWQQDPRPHIVSRQVENVSGNYIAEARDIHESFLITNAESLKYCFNLDENSKDCFDHSAFGRNAELVYEAARCGINVLNLRFCYYCVSGSSNLLYSAFCWGCQDCFGCVALRNKRYCILNKQYSETEYNSLMPKIISHMQETGEWGEFFPLELSPFPYNHTFAQRYFPLSEEEVEAQGMHWYDKPLVNPEGAIDASELPDGLPTVDDPITVKSALSGQAYLISHRELRYYRKLKTPLPRLTYDERMEKRASSLGEVRLFQRTCDKTSAAILSAYPPNSPWIIWDKEIYENEFWS